MNNEKDVDTVAEELDNDIENDDTDVADDVDEVSDTDQEDDAFEDLYDDDGEDSDEDEESDPENEEVINLKKRNKALEGAAKIALKNLGESYSGDAEEALLKVAAEAENSTPDEIRKKIAEDQAKAEAWEKQAASDIRAIHEAFPEAKQYKSLHDLPNKVKFARLMDSGKSLLEAFVESHPGIAARRVSGNHKVSDLAGTKSHLTSSVPKGAKDTSVNISKSEMASLRDVFGEDLSDKEIKALYKRVTR